MSSVKIILDERTKGICKASEGFAFDDEKYMQNMRKLSEATKVSCTEFANAVNKMNKNGGK